MTKLTFPIGMKTMLNTNTKRIFVKAQPFMVNNEIKQFNDMFKTHINKTKKNIKTKLKTKFNKKTKKTK